MPAGIGISASASVASFAAAGVPIAYRFTVTNRGGKTLSAVAVTGPAPISCPQSALAPGASESCTATYTTTAADVTAGAVRTTATAAGTPAGAGATPVTDTTTATIPYTGSADLAVQVSGSRATTTVGQRVVFTVTVSNAGPSTATDTTLTDTVHSASAAARDAAAGSTTTKTSVHTRAGSCTAGPAITCALGDIPAGGGVTVTVDPSTAGTVSDHAEVSSPVADPTPANGAASAKVAVRPAARPHRRLGLVLAASPRRVETGSVVDYTVTVDNPNAVPVAHVTVCDTVPIGVQQLSATPRGGLHGRTRCWTVAHLAAHASRRFTLRASVSTQRGGRLRNRATARAAGIGPTRAAGLLIARAAPPIPPDTDS